MGKRTRDSLSATSTSSGKSSFKYENLHTVEAESDKSHHKRHREERKDFTVKSEAGGERKVATDFLGEDERQYFAAIKIDLAQAVQNMAGEDTSALDEDIISSYEVIWDRIRGREVLIAKDKELSFILENLMRLTGASGVSHAITLFINQCEDTPTLLQDLVCHSCASHIVEEVFERIAVLPDTASVTLDRFLDFLLVTPSIYVDNPYAAHVAEKMLLRLCRIVGYKLEDGKVTFSVFDPDTAAITEFPYNKDDLTSLAGIFDCVISLKQRKLLGKVISVFEALVESPEVGGLSGNIWTSASGSVVLQALLVSLLAYHASNTSKASSASKKVKLEDATTSIALFEKLGQKFRSMAMNKYGSRGAELLIALSPSPLYLQLINSVCSAEFNLDEVLRDNNGHHALIRLVEFCTDIPLLLILTKALCEKIDVILSSGHGMVLVGLVRKLADGEQKKALCGRHGSAAEWGQCQALVVSALKTAYTQHGPQGWTDEQKRDYFVVIIGALYPKNFRKDPKVTAQNICMPGSQIIQSLCQFKENSAVNNSFLKLDADLLTEYCSNTFGSYAIEKLIVTQRSVKNFYQPFLQKLIAVSSDLAMTKSGSRTFDFIWKTVDLKHRELLVEKLLPVEAKLRTNEFGRFLMAKLNLGLFRRSVEAWRAQQALYEKEKSDLRSILELTAKKRL